MSTFTKLLLAAFKRSLSNSGYSKFPDGSQIYLGFYRELSATRTYHASGPNPITFGEIQAWAQLHSWALRPRHVAIIREMDTAWLNHAYERQRKSENGVKCLPVASSHAVSPSLFDAIFGD